MKISWDRVWRNKPREEDYLCWLRGNKAIIALWGSCKNLHYGAAAISGTMVQLYAIPTAAICASAICMCCRYMCCSSYMWLAALDFWTFRAAQMSAPAPSLCLVGSSFPNVYICIWSTLINFTHIKSCQFFGGLFWQLSRKHLLVFENSNAFLTGSQRGGWDGQEKSVFKYNLKSDKFSRLNNCIWQLFKVQIQMQSQIQLQIRV